MTDVHVDTRQSDVEEEPEAPRSTFTRKQIVLFLVFTAVAIGLLYGLLPKLAGLEDTWRRIKQGDPLWLGVAFVFEILSFGGYIVLFRGVFLRGHGARLERELRDHDGRAGRDAPAGRGRGRRGRADGAGRSAGRA